MLASSPHRAPNHARARARRRPLLPPCSSSPSSSFLLRMLGHLQPPAILANSLDLQSRTTTTTRRKARTSTSTIARKSGSWAGVGVIGRVTLESPVRTEPHPTVSVHPFSILANGLHPQSSTRETERTNNTVVERYRFQMVSIASPLPIASSPLQGEPFSCRPRVETRAKSSSPLRGKIPTT
jgi:hypothetical protein